MLLRDLQKAADDDIAVALLAKDTVSNADALARVIARILAFEERYEITSSQMMRQVCEGQLAESADVCSWLMLLSRRSHLERCTRP